MPELTNPQLNKLKALAQRLKPVLKVGRNGLSAAFVQSADEMLNRHELIKIKFDGFKEQKKELTTRLVENTGSRLVMKVGHVIVLYRPPADPSRRVVLLDGV